MQAILSVHQSSHAQHTFIPLVRSMSHILLTSSILCHLKQFSFFNGLPFSLTSIRPTFTYPEHIIALCLHPQRFSFAALPHLLITPHSISESASSAVSTANNSWVISTLPPFTSSSFNSYYFPSTPKLYIHYKMHTQ